MAKRPRHPDKEVEAAIEHAEALGWRVRMQGHWGRLYCPHADPGRDARSGSGPRRATLESTLARFGIASINARTARTKMMTAFDFMLIGSGLDPHADDFEEGFFDAGCDDATIAFQNGRIVGDFSREAESLEEALISAVRDFRAAGATVERIEPDPLVNLADMARRSGLSRAAMTHYAAGQRQSGFPAPIAKVSSSSPLWDWAEVAEWLWKNGRLVEDAAQQAVIVHAANAALEDGAGFARALRGRIKGRELAPA